MIFKEQTTHSTIYLLPLIAEDNEIWASYNGEVILHKSITNFINVYNKDINKPWLDSHIFILFKSGYDGEFDRTSLKKKKNYSTNYSYRIKGEFYDVYVFSVPNEFKYSYNTILEGNVSLLIENVKKKILRFWIKNEKSHIYTMLYPDDTAYKLSNIKYEMIGECDDLENDILEYME